ncbi:unnamed protein product [Parnassius mnemosyne]|uniref:TIR domain-containing protein n=1 Tax=Parnassius mnemosyne TaxID=213953 RepID=A0AAV1KB40_9NEOP
MDATLQCDCGVYWAVRLAREAGAAGAASAVRGARCSDGRALAELRAERLACVLPPARCAPRCACELRGLRLHADCRHAQLARVPRFPDPLLPPAVLLLQNNSIAHLSPDDLPPTLQLVDLSYNRLSDVEAESAAALFAGEERRVRLAGNPLACCGALAAAARAHPARLDDWRALRCGDRPLSVAAPEELCGAPAWRVPAAATGAALLLTAALVAIALVRPAARASLKRFLCTHWSHPSADGDDDRPYDVFVSFSHKDHAFVTEHLVPGLEGGSRPYRVCVHYRDWAAGDWIPAQIARSVRQARRTLAVVSRHWAQSAWARAEFREARAAALRDARPRLLAVLLDEPARLAELARLEPELRDYLASNTYLRWDDPAFWHKLRRALPHGPSAPAPAPATDTPAITTDTPAITTDTPAITTDTPIITTDTPPATPALFTSPVA